jgi:hypothetical protein
MAEHGEVFDSFCTSLKTMSRLQCSNEDSGHAFFALDNLERHILWDWCSLDPHRRLPLRMVNFKNLRILFDTLMRTLPADDPQHAVERALYSGYTVVARVFMAIDGVEEKLADVYGPPRADKQLRVDLGPIAEQLRQRRGFPADTDLVLDLSHASGTVRVSFMDAAPCEGPAGRAA